MSKSLGNGIDPIQVIDLYGADAMKFTLCYMAAQGQDVLIDMNSFKMGSRFANKIWNATRYLLLNLEGRKLVEIKREKLTTFDKWIYHQFNTAAKEVKEAMENYRFNDAADAVYSFFWNDFCDWYIEESKSRFFSEDEDEKDLVVSILMDILEKSMRLMHPFLSFITEEIYQKLPNHNGDVIVAKYPEYTEELSFPEEKKKVLALQDVVKSVRGSRSSVQIPPEKKVKVVIRTDSAFQGIDLIREEKKFISTLMGASELVIDDERKENIHGALPESGNGYESFVFVRDAIDVDEEIRKLEKEIEKARKSLEGTNSKLSNENFLSHAKKEAVEKEMAKKNEFEEKIRKSEEHIALLKRI